MYKQLMLHCGFKTSEYNEFFINEISNIFIRSIYEYKGKNHL